MKIIFKSIRNSIYLFCVFTHLLLGSSYAIAKSERNEKVVNAYLEASGASSFKDESLAALEKGLDDQFAVLSASRSSSKERAILANYRKKISDVYHNKVDWTALKAARIKHAQSEMSDRELKKATKFLRSSLGKKFIAQQRDMTLELTELFKKQASGVQQEIKELYTELAHSLKSEQ